MAMDLSNVKTQALAFGGGLLAGITVNSLINKMSKGKEDAMKIPEKWMKVGNVSKLTIYPVKAMPGIEVDEAEITPLGLAYLGSLRDRVFLVTNDKGDFFTQRQIPSLVLIQPSVNGKVLTLTSNIEESKGSSVSIPFPSEDTQKSKLVRIWQSKVPALDCGDEAAQWLSYVTDNPGLRLVYYALEVSKRTLSTDEKIFPMFSTNDHGTFQDATSYMLMTEESLEELNDNLKVPITVRSFRPSILMKGSPEPWAEDLWNFVRLGDDPNVTAPILKAAMPCQRCKVTTINPDTAESRNDGEPIKTLIKLKEKRKFADERVEKIVKKTAIMGSHMGLFNRGANGEAKMHVKVGDPVYAAVL